MYAPLIKKKSGADIAAEENCPQGKLPPEKLHPHHKISPQNNCRHPSKFPSKSTTSELNKIALPTSTIVYN